MTAQTVGYILGSLTIIYLIGFSVVHGKGMIDGLKGINGKWDPPEIVIAIVLPIFISALLADIFLSLTASAGVWASFNIVIGFALTGRVSLDFIHKKKGDHKSRLSD